MAAYLKGALVGMVSALVLLYLLNITGFIAVSAMGGFSLVPFLQWCYSNLGLSVIPFSAIGLAYGIYLKKFLSFLKIENPEAKAVFALEEKIDLLINIFFGVGVIWTAIGMRNALLASLGNMDAETAAQKGAFYILTQLVEGGILLSLSTTIAGGVGGYVMRLVKAWGAGSLMNAFMDRQADEQSREVLDRLDRIAGLLNAPGKDRPS